MKVLFLGFDATETRLIHLLKKQGCTVTHCKDKIDNLKPYDLVVSFGYRHLLSSEQIQHAQRKILNLHISYLPWNRGAHPNFWSFFDQTPSGVTIHAIDAGVDTGPIAYQKKVFFDQDESTFTATYSRLIYEIEELFIAHMEEILSGKIPFKPQKGLGSYHAVKDLPMHFQGWNCEIKEEIERLRGLSS